MLRDSGNRFNQSESHCKYLAASAITLVGETSRVGTLRWLRDLAAAEMCVLAADEPIIRSKHKVRGSDTLFAPNLIRTW